MQMIQNAVVITRHNGLVEHLKDINLIDDSAVIISHATAEDIAGKDVVGVLPHSLSVQAKTFTEVPLIGLPAELRGQELTVEHMKEYAGDPVTYVVSFSA